MNRKFKDKWLIAYAMCIPLFMTAVFAILNVFCGKTIGYFLPYGIYLAVLLGGILIFGKKDEPEINKAAKEKYRFVYYALCFVPAAATFAVAFLPTVAYINLQMIVIVIVYACLNGCLEELFWRGTFMKVYGSDFKTSYMIPTIIFTCWHVALLFAKGMSYHGGALALVGGACIMGIIWGLAVLKTRNLKIVIVAHVMVNFFAFTQLVCENWFL